MEQREAPRRRFKVSAVRRTAGAPTAVRERRVADEEIVHELWIRKDQLEERMSAGVAAAPGTGQVQVRLTGIDDSAGVLIEFEFAEAGGGDLQQLPDLSAAVIAAVSDVLGEGLGTPVAVSACPEPPKIEEAHKDKEATPWSQIAPVLATVAAGVGVLGFVTFVGGAVAWARLNAAGFPAAPALGVIPSQDLLVIGAETLVPQVIVALVTVVALTLLYLVSVLITRGIHEQTSKRMQTAARQAKSGESSLAMFCFIAVALVVMLLLFKGDLTTGQFFVALGVVLVCALLAAAVGSRTRRFVYLAATSFILAGVFESYLAYSRESSDERVRGAAVIRDNRKAVAGIFVAESSGRVYLARVSETGTDDAGGNHLDVARSRLVGIAKDEVSDVAIGDRKPIREALIQAVSLAKELCELQPQVPPPAHGTTENCRTAPPGERQP
jgi:hypothetical protein